ncbi:unnamed protein product [Effrenium voratum]|uniref:Uncharacterized protein n=1 Tax=Effrenium voratum TaxID=2562239 RepID=A0AA36IYD3_9DINO|nr:unnamed protein product [Effrenium voratum]CAJ1429989.1 unnamed protein product [Effrenium voratum]
MGNDDLDLDGNWAVEKKRKRKASPSVPKTAPAKGVLRAVLASEQLPRSATKKQLRLWAKTRLGTAWVAEAKAKKLTPIEAKELRPLGSWFLPVPPQLRVAQLPGLEGCQRLQGLGSERPGAGCVGALVLCSSVERVFALKAELDAVCPQKALALAKHGGGRLSDQLSRQAKALAAGAALAVATPARLNRLVAEGHLDPARISLVILDLAKDKKQRDVLTLQEARGDFFQLLRGQLLPLLPKAKKGTGLALLLCGAGAASAAEGDK